MKKVLQLLRRDIAHVRHNTVALLVCMGLAIIPSLYAWFNIAGGWNPYENTAGLQVALATSDEGITGTIIPLRINVGDRIVTELAEGSKIGYVVTSEDEAIEGVRSGKYYAAAIIPKNFSSNLLSVFSRNPTTPAIDYYVNEKRNAIASIVTGKATGSIQTRIATEFTEAVTEVAANLFDELTMVTDDKGTMELAGSLSGALGDILSTLSRASSDIEAYKAVSASIRGVMDAATAVLDTDMSALDVSGALRESSTGVRQFEESVNAAKGAATSAADAGSAKAKDFEAALDAAYERGSNKADEIASALESVRAVAQKRRQDLASLLERLNALNGTIYANSRSIAIASLEVTYTHTIENDISDLISRVENAITHMDDLIATIDRTISDLKGADANAEANRAELKRVAAGASASIDKVRESYDGDLAGSLERAAGELTNAADEATRISGTLSEESTKVRSSLTATSADLVALEGKLDEAAAKVADVTGELRGLHERLTLAVSTGDMELVRTIMGADVSSLASFLSSPVELDREALYPVENNGSAMTPYYTTMALWVGGTLMGVLFYAAVSKKALEETAAGPTAAYFGRLSFFVCLGLVQALLLLLGDLFFLKVQCEHPVLFVLGGCVGSVVFVNIIFALATALGDVGKAIAVFIMVIQVAGSGGTFPREMLPPVFQAIYPYLPFVHAEDAFRAAMFGTYGGDWAKNVAVLACFLPCALIIGTVLARLFAPANEWIERKLEETKLM